VEVVRAAEEIRGDVWSSTCRERGGLSFLWFRRREMRRQQRSEFRIPEPHYLILSRQLHISIRRIPDQLIVEQRQRWRTFFHTDNERYAGYFSVDGAGEHSGGVLGIETRVGGRSVGTSKLDNESEAIKVEDASGSTKDDDVTIDVLIIIVLEF
jgi:hypothetical protein